MRVASLFLALALAVPTPGCSSDPTQTPITPSETSSDDTSVALDSAPEDTGTADSSANDADSVAETPPTRFDIIGELTGPCGTLVDELGKTTPSVEYNTLTFATSDKYVRERLSPGGQRIYDTPNAGGSSEESEVMSFEVLHHCEFARVLKTETEIKYSAPDDSGSSSITDILVEIAGKKVGIQITRPYKPAPLTMSDSEVRTLLEKKLQGIIRSTERVQPEDKWVKQILHVFVATAETEAAVRRVLPMISAALKSDTIIVVTRSVGGGFLYCPSKSPPLGSECAPLDSGT